MEVNIKTPKMSVNLETPQMNVGFGIQRTSTGGVKQIYIGPDEPTDPNILIWIDTYVPPITGTQLITSDDKEFITSSNNIFILREEQKSMLLTLDNKQFITADDNEFILADEILDALVTVDNKEFIEANNKNFILREEF